jgi:mannose-6-phosphate isomerase-like protein (cupin superfamily)
LDNQFKNLIVVWKIISAALSKEDIMLLQFSKSEERVFSAMNGGTGEVAAQLLPYPGGKVIASRLLPGASIGLHRHETSTDINFVLSGTGTALCDGVEEPLTPGCCHICPKGSSHSLTNTGSQDLVLLTVVVEG